MRKLLILFILLCLLLVGCNSNSDNIQNDVVELLPLNVVIEIVPEEILPNEPVTFNAYVTHGDEGVEDANEVKFQIWEKGKEDQDEYIDGIHKGEGLYSIEKTFDHDGIFYVVAHVTARDMHNMPKQEFVVGKGEVEADTENETKTEKETGHSHDDHHHGDHSDKQVTFNFSPHESTAGEETKLTVVIQEEEKQLSEATISFEVWKGEADKHEYIKAAEAVPGTYVANYTFPEKGRYEIRIHLEKGELHDHEEYSVEVK
ncbi:FixH family protein [Litchfieldia alkalitelluris]|uniref:FixH family protein n=1 Tax=Litchfieldia alkalitelluris TaxID=304268 RepID=UPI00195ADED2|nr:FixH family protein [Litchfieldia alkalitelluris]